jgi:cytochrome c553
MTATFTNGRLRMCAEKTLRSVVCGLVLALLTIAYAGQAMADEGQRHSLVDVAMCRGCHGIPHYRTAYPDVYSVPKLGGQQAAYIVKALQDYKHGLRAHATMRSIAAVLTDEQVAAIAAYYAGDHK